MLTINFQECPKCGGGIDRRNYTEVRGVDRVTKMLYCEFCDVGYEAEFYDDGYVFALHYSARIEPVNLGRFLQRMEDARAA